MRYWAITVVSLLVSTAAIADPAQCLAPLSPALKTISWVKTGANSEIDLKESVCSATFESTYHHNTSSASITVPIYDVPTTFGGKDDSEANWTKRTQFCGDKSAHYSSASTQSVYLEYANPDQFKAYATCIQAQQDKIPVSLSAKQQGNTIVVKADYTIIGDHPQPAIVKNFSAPSLICKQSDTFHPGDKITPGGTSHSCTRADTGIATIISLNTTEGERELPIPRRHSGTVAGTVSFVETRNTTQETKIRDVEYWFDLDGLNGDSRSYTSPRTSFGVNSDSYSRPTWHTDDPTAHYLESTWTNPSTGAPGTCGCEEHEPTNDGYGCPFVYACQVTWDGPGAGHLVATNGGRRVGVGIRVGVAINQTVPQTTESTVTELYYGRTFVVPINSGSTVSLKVHSHDYGDYVVSVNNNSISDPNGLLSAVAGSVQVQGSTTYLSLTVEDPEDQEFQALQ